MPSFTHKHRSRCANSWNRFTNVIKTHFICNDDNHGIVLWSWDCSLTLDEEETAIEWINVELFQLLNWMLYIFETIYSCVLNVCRLKKNTLNKSSVIITYPQLNSNHTLSRFITAAGRCIAIPCNYMMTGSKLRFVLLKNITNSLVGGVALHWADHRVGGVLNWIKLY